MLDDQNTQLGMLKATRRAMDKSLSRDGSDSGTVSTASLVRIENATYLLLFVGLCGLLLIPPHPLLVVIPTTNCSCLDGFFFFFCILFWLVF